MNIHEGILISHSKLMKELSSFFAKILNYGVVKFGNCVNWKLGLFFYGLDLFPVSKH